MQLDGVQALALSHFSDAIDAQVPFRTASSIRNVGPQQARGLFNRWLIFVS